MTVTSEVVSKKNPFPEYTLYISSQDSFLIPTLSSICLIIIKTDYSENELRLKQVKTILRFSKRLLKTELKKSQV